MKGLLVFVLSLQTCLLAAQNVPIDRQKFIFFPYPAQRKWVTSVGVTATTMPYEITEELHYRIPAADLHIIKKLTEKLVLDARLNFQVIQNFVTLGPHYNIPLTERVSVGLGDDLGFWFGFVNVQGFKTRGSGWQNFPNASLGYRFNKRILLTVRGDVVMTGEIAAYAGENPIHTNYKLFSGSSYAIILEQPFYGHKSISLGFRAIYTSFFWQTWSAFTNYNRNFFYPQLIIGLIL